MMKAIVIPVAIVFDSEMSSMTICCFMMCSFGLFYNNGNRAKVNI